MPRPDAGNSAVGLIMRTSNTIAVCVVACIVALAALTGLVALPILRNVYRVSQVAKQYRLESAVQSEIESDKVHKPTVNEILDPKFMKKYNLNSERYLDAQGYFSPTGNDWANWSLETRTAAILMWKDAPGLSAWHIYRTIRRVDDYYRSNDRSVPLVKVVNASFAQ
jgi:hypothetical protein